MALPASVEKLFAERAAALVAGHVRLFAPGSEEAQDGERAFAGADIAAWGWLRGVSVVVGRAARAFVVATHEGVAADRLWLAHASGTTIAAGSTLEHLATLLASGLLFVLDGLSAETVATLGLAPTVDARDYAGELVTAMQNGSDDAIDGAVSAMLESGPTLDRIAVALSLAEAAGSAGDTVRATSRTLHRRNPVIAELATKRAGLAGTTTAQLHALGLHADATMSRPPRMLAARQPPKPVHAEVATRVAAVEAVLPAQLRAEWRTALAACSPDDAFTLAQLAAAASPHRPNNPPAWFAHTSLTDETMWAALDSERTWPLCIALWLFTAITQNAAARQPLIASVTDAVILSTTTAPLGLISMRAAVRDFDLDDARRAISVLETYRKADGPVPMVYELLARLPFVEAVEALIPYAAWGQGQAFAAARTVGKCDASLAMLAELYGHPRTYGEHLAREACELAVSWGSGAAKKALPACEAAVAAYNKRYAKI